MKRFFKFALFLFIPVIFITFLCTPVSGKVIAKNLEQKEDGKPIRVLYGTISPHTNIPNWFNSLKSWGTQRFYLFSPHYRGYQYSINSPIQLGYDKANFSSVGLLSNFSPEYKPFIDSSQTDIQEKVISKVRTECKKNHIELGIMIPFPIFPVQKMSVVKQIQPEFVREDGRLNIYSPEIPVLLKEEIQYIKKNIPELKSICLWLAEGCGEIYKFDDEDLINNKQWLRPILKALDEVCQELDIEGVVFGHDYFHTVKTRSQAFEVNREFPKVVLMEDITWPEENTLMPFMGHFTKHDHAVLQTTPLMMNFLVDTEYLGQGNWSAVLPRWWKSNVMEAGKVNCQIIAGRTFFWDNAQTDRNFNRLNAHLLMLFASNPQADARVMLAIAAKEAFGSQIPERLIEILWETEPVIQDIIAINSISSLKHSGFPHAFYFDADYYTSKLNMKVISDLFAEPGTSLNPGLSDSLNASMYWRYERNIKAKSYSSYLQSKENAIHWLQQILPEVVKLTSVLNDKDALMFRNGYQELYLLARGMKCFLEAAKVHYDWYRAKTITKEEALRRMAPIAAQVRIIAESDKGYSMGYKEDMIQFAKEIETLQIIKGK